MKDVAQRVAGLSPTRRRLLEARLRQARPGALPAAEPVAVIGIGCLLPGGVAGPADYWRLLVNRTDAVRRVPPERWDADAYYDPDFDAPGKMATRHGGFLDAAVDQFDAAFFGISPREAASLDPQQRLLLE